MFRKQHAAPFVAPEVALGYQEGIALREPYRTQAMHPDITVPLYQAVISATLLGVTAVTVLWLATQALKLPVQLWLIWLPSPTIELYVGLFLLVSVPATLRFWNQNLDFARSTIMIQRLERVVGHDLTGDGVVGHPLRVNAPATETPAQKAQREFKQFVLDCFEHGTTYAALRGQGWRDPAIDRYATWALENGIGRLKGKTNKSGWELAVSEVQALKIVGDLEWLGKKSG